MNYLRRLLMTSLLVLLLAPYTAQAQTILNAERLSVIQQRCSVLQVSLDQLQRRDLVARTDNGREYENIIRQIDAFSLRLRNNNLPSQLVDTPAAQFKAAVAAFRAVYIRYDDSMNILRSIDCRNRTADFAQFLEQTRVLRTEVAVEVTKGEEALGRYRQAMVTLQSTLPRTASNIEVAP